MTDQEELAAIRERDAQYAEMPGEFATAGKDRRALLAMVDRLNLLCDKKDQVLYEIDFAIIQKLVEQRDKARHEFKNFHRLLCERFNYFHDEADWSRDQLSLIEHIARQITDAHAENGRLRTALERIAADTCYRVPRCDELRITFSNEPETSICSPCLAKRAIASSDTP